MKILYIAVFIALLATPAAAQYSYNSSHAGSSYDDNSRQIQQDMQRQQEQMREMQYRQEQMRAQQQRMEDLQRAQQTYNPPSNPLGNERLGQ